MIKFATSPLTLAAVSLAISTVGANAQTTVYSETFDPVPEVQIDFNMQLGGNPDLKPTNTKIFPLGQWGYTSNGGIVDVGGGNALQPQLDTKNNARSAGLFIDPTLFASTGAGTYTLTFDVIPSSSAGAGRVYVGAGSGYDLSGATNAKLSLNISAAGFGVKKADGTPAWAALTASDGATATHLITTTTQWILADGTETGEFREAPGAPFDVETAATLSFNFEYDGSSTVVIAFGGYNTDFKVDNVTIATAVPGGNTWAGYPVDELGWADTTPWLGWINVTQGDYIWSLALGKYIYLPEVFVGESGAWSYVPQ